MIPSTLGAATLLLDVPLTGLEAILQRLSSSDLAALRPVSRAVSSRTTLNVPYINVRLSSSTTAEQLQLWWSSTRRFRHVNTIHVHCSGAISSDVFKALCLLLSQHGGLRHVHLHAQHGSSSCSSQAATLLSLGPMGLLQRSLKTLSLSGITVTDLVDGFAGWGTKTGRPLQELNLQFSWLHNDSGSWPALTALVTQMPCTFPNLQRLALRFPPSQPPCPSSSSSAAVLPADSAQLCSQQAIALAASAAAVAQLHYLQSLELTSIPDIWATAAAGGAASVAAAHGLGIPAGYAAAPIRAAAAAYGLPNKAMGTLDGLGSWQLWQSQQLKRVHLETHGTHWALTWHRGEGGCESGSRSSSSTVKAPNGEIVPAKAVAADGAAAVAAAGSSSATRGPAVKASYHAGFNQHGVRAQTSSTVAACGSSIKEQLKSDLAAEFQQYAVKYVPCTHAIDLSASVTHLQLAIQPNQLAALRGLLGSMQQLLGLKATLLTTSSQPAELSALVRAGAAAPSVTSLVLLAGLGPMTMGLGVLEPLTAAGGGPGNRLKQLRLVANFSNAAAAANEATADHILLGAAASAGVSKAALGIADNIGRSAKSAVTCCAAKAVTSAAVAQQAWAPLQQLQGLQEFRIQQTGWDLVEIPLTCLPAPLEVLEGKKIHFTATGSMASVCSSSGRSFGMVHSSPTLPLHTVVLQQCKLDNAESLLGGRLRQLTVADASCPGGWSAVAAVAPNVSSMTVWCRSGWKQGVSLGIGNCDVGKGPSSNASSSNTNNHSPAGEVTTVDTAEAEWLMHQLVSGFEHLQTLTVQNLPCLSADVLRHIAQLSALKHLNISTARVKDTVQDLAACYNIAASNSSSDLGSCGRDMDRSSSRLRSVTLRVPGRVPAAVLNHLQQHQQQQPGSIGCTASIAAAAGASAARNLHDINASSGSSTSATGLQEALQQALQFAHVSVVANQVPM